jgi:DivIVA domain-containing protein
MELTPRALREVEFREKLRGYNPADVDAFLEEVAGAVGDLQARLRALEANPPHAAEATSPDVKREATLSEETVARALLAAQDSLDRTIAEAEDLARTIEARARAEAVRMVTAAEHRLEEEAAAARRTVEARMQELDQGRTSLEQEIVWLRSWVARRRDELVDALWDRPPWYESTYPKLGLVVDFVAGEPADLIPAERQQVSGSERTGDAR